MSTIVAITTELELDGMLDKLQDSFFGCKQPTEFVTGVHLFRSTDHNKEGTIPDASLYLFEFGDEDAVCIQGEDESSCVRGKYISPIIHGLKNMWMLRQSARIEGFNFELGDYFVEIGTLSIGALVAGVVIKVTYAISLQSPELLNEFITSFVHDGPMKQSPIFEDSMECYVNVLKTIL